MIHSNFTAQELLQNFPKKITGFFDLSADYSVRLKVVGKWVDVKGYFLRIERIEERDAGQGNFCRRLFLSLQSTRKGIMRRVETAYCSSFICVNIVKGLNPGVISKVG